jgi:hypothetical protein
MSQYISQYISQYNSKYYWGTPDMSVSFCETKYNNVFWIAEYYNTISAIPYVLLGILFFKTKIKKIGICLIFMGISTMIMHSTIRCYGQWLDEVGLLVLSFETLKKLDNKINYILAPPILGIYVMLNEHFFVFFSIFATMQITIAYKVYHKKKSPIQKIWSSLYVFFFLLAFICWFIDQTFCKYIGDTQFHALWHLYTCIAMFYGYHNFL